MLILASGIDGVVVPEKFWNRAFTSRRIMRVDTSRLRLANWKAIDLYKQGDTREQILIMSFIEESQA